MKKLLSCLVLVLTLNASSQNVFFTAFTFLVPESSQDAEAWAIFEEEGGFVATGIYMKNIQWYLYCIKTDHNGDTLWMKSTNLGYPYQGSWAIGNEGYKVFTVDDSIFRFDSQWNVTSLAPLPGVDHPRKVAILEDGNYLFANWVTSNHYNLVKVNSQTLEIIWVSEPLLQDFIPDYASGFTINSILEESDGKIVVVTNNYYVYNSSAVNYGSSIFHLDEEGHVLNTYLNPDVNYYSTFIENENFVSLTYDYYHSITTHTANGDTIQSFELPHEPYGRHATCLTKDGEKVIVLEYNHVPNNIPMYLEAYEQGSLLWSADFQPSDLYGYVDPITVIPTSDGGYLIYGNIHLAGTIDHYPFLLKTDSNGNSAPLGLNEPARKSNFSISPNPSSDFIEIIGDEKINMASIYDIRGELITSTKVVDLTGRFNISNFQPGAYILKITTDKGVTVLKFLKR